MLNFRSRDALLNNLLAWPAKLTLLTSLSNLSIFLKIEQSYTVAVVHFCMSLNCHFCKEPRDGPMAICMHSITVAWCSHVERSIVGCSYSNQSNLHCCMEPQSYFCSQLTVEQYWRAGLKGLKVELTDECFAFFKEDWVQSRLSVSIQKAEIYCLLCCLRLCMVCTIPLFGIWFIFSFSTTTNVHKMVCTEKYVEKMVPCRKELTI